MYSIDISFTSVAWVNLILLGFLFGLGFAVAGWLWSALVGLLSAN